MKSFSKNLRTFATVVGITALGQSGALAQVTFNFEEPDQLSSSPLVSGDVSNFITTTEHALSGDSSMRFDYTTPDAFQSWTYDMPFEIEEGTLSLWFHDAIGGNAEFNRFGGSIILEDAEDPRNFLAVEIWNAPYPSGGGTPNYYLTRGRANAATTFSSGYFGDRSVGWHEVVFDLGAEFSTVSVDGISNASGVAQPPTGPGTSGAGVRLRFMAFSATNGGFSNWANDPAPLQGFDFVTPYVRLDDLRIEAVTPEPMVHTNGFEDGEYDTPSVFMGPSANDNPYMRDFFNTFGIDNEVVRTGANSARFINGVPVFKSVLFDLADAEPGEVTINFHDLLGTNAAFDKLGATIMIEQVSDPSNFLAVEIWNAPYPTAGAGPNYYLVKGTPGSHSTQFSSGYFGGRKTGWNTVTFTLTEGASRIAVNGISNVNGIGDVTGPGIGDGIRVRIMADSASCGGFTNYAHPATTELNYLYALQKDALYLSFDDITLPIPTPTSSSSFFAIY